MTGNSAMADAIVLIEPLIPALRRYAYALLRNHAEADDLLQDALERAVGRWHQRRPDGDARSWMFSILHNLAADRLRRKARRGIDLAIENVAHDKLAHPPTQEHGLNYGDVLDAIQALPEDQRAVLLLVAVESLSYLEVAQILRIPPGTVMSRLARARERLLRLMDSEAAGSLRAAPRLRRVK